MPDSNDESGHGHGCVHREGVRLLMVSTIGVVVVVVVVIVDGDEEEEEEEEEKDL